MLYKNRQYETLSPRTCLRNLFKHFSRVSGIWKFIYGLSEIGKSMFDGTLLELCLEKSEAFYIFQKQDKQKEFYDMSIIQDHTAKQYGTETLRL